METLTDPQHIANFMAATIYRNAHHHYEQMARRVENPGAIGCWHGQRLSGLGEHLIINVYRPREGRASTLHPVIAFGNTRLSVEGIEQLLADVREDLFPLGIGTYRWAYNGGRILQLLQDLSSEFQKRVILTGHSLGGVLAQITSCYAAALVESVITFQSPKTSRGVVSIYRHQAEREYDRLKRQTFHYTVRGDAIANLAGEVFTPGVQLHVSYQPAFLDPGDLTAPSPAAIYAAHTLAIFPPFAELDAIRSEGVRVARRMIESIRVGRVDPRPSTSLVAQLVEWLRAHAGGVQAILAAALVTDSLYILAWDTIAQAILALRTPEDIRRSCRDLRRLRFVLFAWPSAAFPVTPGDFLTEAQVDNMRRQIDLLCRQGRTAAESPIASPLMQELRGSLELTEAGAAYLREADRARAGGRTTDYLNEIFTGSRTAGVEGVQSAWLELVIAEDILRHFAAERVGSGTGQRGMYRASTEHGDAIILVGLTLRAVLGELVDAGVIRMEDLPGDDSERLDEWSVIRYLVDTVRGPRPHDEDLQRAYFYAHQWYLSCEKQDPLNLLSPQDIARECCDVSERELQTFTLDQFRALAAAYAPAADRGLVPGPAAEEARARYHAWVWYKFLFKLDGDGTGFVADEHFTVTPCTLSSGPCRLPAGGGIKKLGDKRIDIVQIIPARQYIEVLDATYRFDLGWHNFKSEVYASFFRRLFAGLESDWRVDALDYRNSHMRHGTLPRS